MKTKTLVLCLALPGLPVLAVAQSASCPALPEGSGLHWESTAGDGFDVCRAVDDNGRQLLGMLFSQKKPGVELARNQRQEEDSVGRYTTRWYRPRIADAEVPEKRITVLELEDGRYAQVWIDADSSQSLQRNLALARAIALD
jgi:hypothetical protein